MIDNRTAHLNLPLPDSGNKLSEDVVRIAQSLTAIDTLMADEAIARAAADVLLAPQSSTYTKTETETRIQAVVGAAPAALDTLVEIAAQLANDESAASALTSAVSLKAPLASPTFTGTVSGVSKAMVGLGSIDNTSDLDKPVSTAQAAAIGVETNARTAADALLAPLASPTFTGTVSGISKSMVGLGNVDSTADLDKPVSTAQATADTATLNSAKTYAEGLVVGLWDDRGVYDASVNTDPTTGGSGAAGAILKGDIWTISVVATSGVLLGYSIGTNVRAVIDSPAQVADNWAVVEVGLGYVPANTANSLAQFASTTSAQLAGVLSDETGSGAVVFSNSPTLVTPALGTPSALVGTNITGTAANLTAGNATLAATATTANATETANNFQMKSLGIGTAASAVAGEIRATNNVTAYYSDERLKDVIGTIDGALDAVLSLSGVRYKANSIAGDFGYDTNKIEVGVLAQQVQAVLPEIVTPAPFDITQNEDGSEYSKSGETYLTVHYERLVPLLIEAIKELALKVNLLEKVS